MAEVTSLDDYRREKQVKEAIEELQRAADDIGILWAMLRSWDTEAAMRERQP